MTSFVSKLSKAIIAADNPLCVGLDPFVQNIPLIFGAPNKISTLEAFFNEVIDALQGNVAVIKPQIGLFEPWGADGFALVSRLTSRAKANGLLVILDAKRGDIGTTAQGYADAYLGPNPAIDCDCVTLNPYLGIETLEPFVKNALAYGKSIAVLVRTSNPGAKDFQDLMVAGEPLWVKVAQSLKPIEARLMDSDMSSLMVVIGATWPNEAAKLREILPHTQFLIPGYGAQGGSAEDAFAGLINKGNRMEGGLISSSRAVLYPQGAQDCENIAAWRDIFSQNLDNVIADLRLASENVIARV
ncbi:MAG: orotidine-5'-phosphate decarboxylase [Hyphomonadaceae bacterium]|nr:MAG: orotidine-5'-phosphate decarboxylase [Hyphomonadaceae bacterium]KAF0186992.1 MAG: orotidine-5'-phosphate decarboxylase [Hyphomonadaceae bacterium]